MEIKSVLNKPYSNEERMEFIVEFNHNKGYKIEETEAGLQALGYTEEEIAEQEANSLSQLKLTKREVFLALYKDCGITPEQVKAGITDAEALIEFEYANEYYRGNPLVDMIGTSLGYTKEQLDYLFKNKKFATKGGEIDA